MRRATAFFSRHTLAFFGLAALYAAGAFSFHVYEQRAAAAFSDALDAASVRETVFVRGETYNVRDGRVFAGDGRALPETSWAARSAQRIAYAAAQTRRSPLFGLSGTDVDALRSAIAELETSQDSLAELQETRNARRDVARSLYPIRFLKALADAEEARRRFLGSPSDDAYRAYNAELRRALFAYRRDLVSFERAFDRQVSNTAPLVVRTGIITKESIVTALSVMHERAARIHDERMRRTRCLSGAIALCAANDLKKPPVEIPEYAETSRRASLSLAHEVVSIIVAAHPDDRDTLLARRTLVALEGSSCARELPAPHYMLLYIGPEESEDAPPVESLLFVGDLLSYPLDKELPREHLFAFFSPTTYYLCPTIGEDISRARATVRALAHRDTGTDLSYRSGFIADERDARTYARETESGTNEFAVMFADNGAGFELLVRDIAAQQNAVARQAQNFPTDTSAEWNFLTRSGFASLFLLHHRTMAPAIPITAENTDRVEPLLRWSDLRAQTRLEDVVEDVRAFLKEHRIE